MRILIISYFFPPLHAVASLRPGSWARTWSEMGHDVTVLTIPKKGLPTTPSRPMPEGVKVVEIGLPRLFYQLRAVGRRLFGRSSKAGVQTLGYAKQGNPSLLKSLAARLDSFRSTRGLFMTARMPDASDLWVRPALKWARGSDPWDVVVSSSGPYSTHLIASRIKKESLARFWVADFRDLWADSHSFRGLFPLTVLEEQLERWAVKHADMMTTVSGPLRETLAGRYGTEKAYVIENGFESSDLADLQEDCIFPQDGKVRIVYTGSLYAGRQHPQPLFESVARMVTDNDERHLLDRLEIIFCGSRMSGLSELIKKSALHPWIQVIGVVQRPEALRMQRDAHALLFFEWDQGAGMDGILTGKLFEYMSSGTPIWGIGVTEKSSTGRLMQETETGKPLGSDVFRITNELRVLLATGQKSRVSPRKEVLAKFERSQLSGRMLQIIHERSSLAVSLP
jgi:glycosyltransferase involved in cell wall biosynthesis